MKILTRLLVWSWLGGVAWAAPLFQDLPPDRWAVDAVRSLAERGLLEGFPDGTFKGDRAASRYEVAMLVARLLARMERAHGQFATRAELDQIGKLAEAYREELEALGVRVERLEHHAERLDARVSELERITFKGNLTTRFVAQSFRNTGNVNSGAGAGGLNYSDAVGAVAGSNLFPTLGVGVVPVIDLTRGRPLTNGAGFSSSLYLDLGFRPAPDWEASLRLAAYTGQGDAVVDAVWGVTPPYLSNSFTGRNPALPSGDALQNLNHSPFTQLTLDRLSVTHGPSNATLALGTWSARFASPQVFLGQANPTVGNPRVLENYGVHLSQDLAPWGWEAFYTRLPDGFPGANAPAYQSDALGAAVTWSSDEWIAGLTFVRAANQPPPGGGPFTVGQVSPQNAPGPAAFYLNWANPPGYLVNQVAAPGSIQVAGAGSTTDIRPIPGLPDSDALSFGASFGPQENALAGVSLTYTGDPVTAFAEAAWSNYKPNRNSSFSREGSLWKVGLEALLAGDEVELRAEYRHTDPTYDPMSLSFPGTVAGVGIFRVYHRVPDFNTWWHQYHLHNSRDFPHNRRGLWTHLRWQYDPDGFLKLSYRDLGQVRSSLQDVRLTAGSLAPGTPTALVLGFTPGFFDPVFRGYSTLSFGPGLAPLEDQRGRAASWAVQGSQAFTGSPWRLDADYERWRFTRPSSLTAAQGGSQNRVDYHQSVGRAALGYQAAENLLVTAGYEQGHWFGHYDPQGLYNPFAIASASTTFRNTDTLQKIPFLELNWEPAQSVRVGATLRWIDTVDRVPVAIFSGPPGGGGSNVHPFSWSGFQLATTVDCSF
ncbi:MAG: S-layer homology domain-containing protein [Candidatus Eremiobacterota bacterium]